MKNNKILKFVPINLSQSNFSKKNRKGFTLVEMLLAIAILVVLSGAILVSISAQREKARATRMLSEVSAVIPGLYMCLSDGGAISSPNAMGGNIICNLSSNYGDWPLKADDFGNYNTSNSASFGDDSWRFYLDGNGVRVCCNANMSGCKNLPPGNACTANNP